jgi:hypothetical protein
MISVEFRSMGPGKCRWCKKDKELVISLAFSDGSFVGSYCFPDFKKALLDKLESSMPQAAQPSMPAKPNGPPAHVAAQAK